jgi:hypothetical protein
MSSYQVGKRSEHHNKASKLNIGQVLDLTLFSAYYLSLSLSRTQVKVEVFTVIHKKILLLLSLFQKNTSLVQSATATQAD